MRVDKKEKLIENCLLILLDYFKHESSDKAVRITLSLIYDQGYADAKEEMKIKFTPVENKETVVNKYFDENRGVINEPASPKLDMFKGDNFSNE